ncbi:alpha/beta fold hydrolase [Longivirga aurantiaca]|uniref:Alpha/beta fold hydrolase n=1 Tax=Longivirga aurantiaca TaxID=1837743 RepID=A0ABW1T2G6_9ACTN
MTAPRPELGSTVVAAGISTNYLHAGSGDPVVLLHGSGPGVTAYANWRLTIPVLSQQLAVYAPDLVGFGFTERPDGVDYSMDTWVGQVVGFLDALGLGKVALVGNSFGGALALRVAARHPDRVSRLVLMGSVGVPFEITDGLDRVWGYEPSLESMRELLGIFAHSRELVTDELAQVRYEASIQPGFQESFSAMFPAPRQRWVDAMVTPDDEIARLPQPTLVVHGREDQVIPLSNALHLLDVVPDVRLHVFGRCGHWTQIEHAAAFSRLVLDFLTE